MQRIILFLSFNVLAFFISLQANAQLFVTGGGLVIDSGAVINLKGDLISNTDINGTGKIILNGTIAQNVSMNNYSIPNLEVNNAQNITLASGVKIQRALIFVNGKIVAGNNIFTLSNVATASGMGAGKFIETNGTGLVYKELTSNVTSFEMPIGFSSGYHPLFLTSNATLYSNAKIGVKSMSVSNPNRPSFSTDYLNTYWPITRTGIAGTVTAVGQYVDPTDVVGTEASFRGCFHDGYQWSSISGTNDAVLNRVGAAVSVNGGSLYGMTRFAMVGIKSFLQGFYNSGAMNAGLYTLALSTDLTATDSVSVNLWSASTLNNSNPNYSIKSILHTNGYSNIILPESTIGSRYYLALNHRNSIETWSANTVLINTNTDYDFTSSLSSAYGDGVNPPMKLMPDGKYAIYAGDANRDGGIDISDMQIVENNAADFIFGYYNSDCNGDGSADISDMQLIENNAGLFIYYARP